MDSCCVPTCATTPPVIIPGSPGTPGAPGAAGADGVSAYSVLSASMVVPGDTSTPVTITVNSTLWMVVGEALIIGQGNAPTLANPGPATFKITAIPSPLSVTMLWLNAPGDVAAGTAISAGAIVTPTGTSAVLANDSVTAANLDESARGGIYQYGVGVFAANVYAVTLTPAATVYTAGQRVVVNPDTDNAGPTDLNVNTIGAANLLKLNGAELAADDIKAGQVFEAIYSGSDFRLIGPIAPAFFKATATLNFGNTLAQTSAGLTIAVPGAAVGDPVSLAIPAALGGADSCFTAYVSAADTVLVQFNNYSSGAIDPASGSFTVCVMHF